MQEFAINLSVVASRDNFIPDNLYRVYPQEKSKFQVEALNDTDVGYVDFITFSKAYAHESLTMVHLHPKSGELSPDVKDEVPKLHSDECMPSWTNTTTSIQHFLRHSKCFKTPEQSNDRVMPSRHRPLNWHLQAPSVPSVPAATRSISRISPNTRLSQRA